LEATQCWFANGLPQSMLTSLDAELLMFSAVQHPVVASMVVDFAQVH
jgi:hypothetical protein